MKEKDIIAGIKDNRRDAQKAFVDTYSRYMYAICVRYVGDTELAKDCLQESLMQVLNNISKYSEEGKFKAWISTVTVMKCLGFLRKERKRKLSAIEDSPEFKSEEMVHLKLEQKDVLDFIQSLPDQYRIALNMFLVEGYRHQEIAKHLNISVGSSRSLVSRGRQMVRKAFDEEHMQIIYRKDDDETKNPNHSKIYLF